MPAVSQWSPEDHRVPDGRNVLNGTQGDALIHVANHTGVTYLPVCCTYCSLSAYLRNKGTWQIIVTSGVELFLNHRDRLKFFMLSYSNF